MKSKLAKTYDPKNVEDRIYEFWMKTGFFNPDKLPGKRKKQYCITIPPPNVTGNLHMGHALQSTIQDILIRWKRLKGYKTLWLPGTDHAGIGTEAKVKKQLIKEGKTREELGREKFIERIWQWKEKYGNIILNQFKRMGCSLDWSRIRFTMDEDYSKAVKKTFLHYHKKGLIYQAERPVNWCIKCKTSLSDLELERKEKDSKLWYIRYPIKQDKKIKSEKQEYITVATTRPETMLGDTAVAVNPKDKKYKKFIGKSVILPFVRREIPIIADRMVDIEFGTGAVKVTPAHDPKDYIMGIAHKLRMIKVINEENKMSDKAPLNYIGLKVSEAREKIINDLNKLGLIEKIEDYIHQVPKCYRCNSIIEIVPSNQWFMKMDKLAKMAEKEVKSGRIKFYPKRFEKTYFDWLSNIHDWCISRQIWWGHKVPIKGSDDVLDTWFSSALWPFAVLGWPKKTKDLKTYYPTNVLTTARDIINLWVARMVFSGMEFMKKKPFDRVYVHPTILAKDGRRMSKSLGTGIDPLDLIDKYGADATRFGLSWILTGAQDVRFNEDTIIMGKKFCNKIWNATRFVIMQVGDKEIQVPTKVQISKLKLSKNEKKILSSIKKTTKSIDKYLDKFEFGQASQALYDFFWREFCDKCIEDSKKTLTKAKTEKEKLKTKKVLLYALISSLKLLHPFIPFITEEIYQNLPIKKKKESLMIEEWPV
ncbi:MAG: valine--tRNA ligase [Patescibacteria group bacterium]|nr:valine--tRNA ligase [Patescibacteria group bacterium]